MKLKKTATLIALTISAAMVFSGCEKRVEEKSAGTPAVPAAPAAPAPEAQPPQGKQIVLSKFGPEKTKAGQAFNKQPNGSAAFWANGENISNTTVVVLNGTQLKSAAQNNGTFITAGPIPKELYATPGTYPLYLLDTKSGAKSNEMKFTVQ